MMIVIYSGNDCYKIKIGKGEHRVVIDLPDIKKQSKTQTDSRTVKISRHEKDEKVHKDTSAGVRDIIGAGLGAVGTAGVYVGLSANPVTGPLMLAATGGAMLGSVLMHKDKSIVVHSTTTYTVECPADQIEKASQILQRLEF